MLTRSTAAPILTVEQVGALLIQPVISGSIAAQVSTIVNTGASSFRIPTVTADPSAAWVAEGAEISPSDITLAETDVSFVKVAGLVPVSAEAAQDTTPEAAAAVGAGLARDIARKVDAAYFGSSTANGPSGLLSLTTAIVTSGAAFTVDAFIDAIAAAATVGATIDNFVVSPADFVALSKLKQATGSNVPLLENDPTKPTGRVLLGVPLLLSPAVAAGTAWGIPASRCYFVVRSDATVEADSSVWFSSDRIAVRAKMRVGFGFPHALAVVKITHT